MGCCYGADGPKEGHAGKMPSKYKVVDNSEQELVGSHVSYQPTFLDEKNVVRNDSLEQDRPDSSHFISRQDSWLED